jgi:tryptophan synthase alpha subunit
MEVANLTITVDGETVKRARMRALEEGTSVNALLPIMRNRPGGPL